MIISKGKIRIDNSDGTHSDLDFVIPHEVAKQILCDIINWEHNYTDSVTNVKRYLQEEKAFLKELENKK